MGKVVGIGGVFFLAKDPEKLKQWYQRHLAMSSVFFTKNVDDPEVTNYSVWDVLAASPFLKNSPKDFFYSYRVDDLESLERSLSENNIKQVLPAISDADGRFIFIDDPDNNRIILWQPSPSIPDSPGLSGDRVSGLGGVFFKASDTQKSKDWYQKYLGFDVTKWGCSFQWIDPANSDTGEPAETAWSPFPNTTEYFLPSTKDFMLNYRVNNLKRLVDLLKSEGVDVVKPIEETDFGNFCWVMDPEGNKMELWEAEG